MQTFLHWLASSPYALLFGVVLAAVLLDKLAIKGIGLGIAACAIVAGVAISAYAATLGVRVSVDPSVRALFYCLFVYVLGLRIGPSLANGLKGQGLQFAMLAAACALLGLAFAVVLARIWDLPAGAAAGILAGAATVPSAIGAAEEAVHQGAFAMSSGQRIDDVTGMIAISYALTCLWGSVGLAIVCKWLPRWWGLDAGAEAKRYEEHFGVPNVDDAGLTGFHPMTVRAYRLTNDTLTGWTVRQFGHKYPRYQVLNVLRVEPARRAAPEANGAMSMFGDGPMALAAAGVASTTVIHEVDLTPAGHMRRERGLLPETQYTKLGAASDLAFRQGDIITIGSWREQLAQIAGLIGPEVSDPAALNVPIDHAEIVVTNADIEGKELVELRNEEFAGQVVLHHVERGGVPIPLGLHTKLQRFDVLFVAGIRGGIEKLARIAGRFARSGTAVDIMALSLGMALGLALGAISFPLGGANVRLGNAGGLLVAGVIVSAVGSRFRLLGSAPTAARNLIEELGLVAFVAIVGINAGEALVTALPADTAVKILAAGFVAGTIPPIAAWAIGCHAMHINPAILVGAVAGARSQPGPVRDSANEIGSSVPWIGYPAAYAVSTALVTLFGYVAMALSK